MYNDVSIRIVLNVFTILLAFFVLHQPFQSLVSTDSFKIFIVLSSMCKLFRRFLHVFSWLDGAEWYFPV